MHESQAKYKEWVKKVNAGLAKKLIVGVPKKGLEDQYERDPGSLRNPEDYDFPEPQYEIRPGVWGSFRKCPSLLYFLVCFSTHRQ